MPDIAPELRPPSEVALSSDSRIWAKALLELVRANSIAISDPAVFEYWIRTAMAQGYCTGLRNRTA
jgi:hypothetical protein